jgi:hypothetical protein
MLKRVFPTLCLGLLAVSASAQTAPAAGDASELVQEKILVVGQRPGPGMWKVSRGDHVLWVFGTYSPLPKNMEWRSREVDAILAQAQEAIQPPASRADVGIFKMATLIPHAFGLTKNPDGATLRDLLPPAVYARWLPLKAKYIGADESIERQRPLFAAGTLYGKALFKFGLEDDKPVRDAIGKLIEKHKIKVTSSSVMVEFDDPAKAMKDFKKESLDDAACFSKTLDTLETDLDAMRVRANAWAKGDLDEIRKLNFSERENACKTAMRNSAAFKGQKGMQLMRERMIGAWMAAAESALANNTTSFAMLQLKDILDPTGPLAALQAKGYAIVAPD